MSRIPIATAIKAASEITRVPAEMICGTNRIRHLSRLRWAIAVVARRRGYSTPMIGKALGGRDHSTIVHALQQAEYLQAKDIGFVILIDEIEALSLAMHNKLRDDLMRQWRIGNYGYARPANVTLEFAA